MSTVDLFDYAEGQRRKEKGIAAVAEANPLFLDLARKRAVMISSSNGRVNSDQLRHWAESVGLNPRHHNAWGSVFKGKCWECVGYTVSARPEAHGRRIAEWRHIMPDRKVELANA